MKKISGSKSRRKKQGCIEKEPFDWDNFVSDVKKCVKQIEKLKKLKRGKNDR